MKKLQVVLTTVLFLLSLNLIAQTTKEKVLVTSVKYDADTELKIDLCGTIELEYWNENFIGIILHVSTNLEHEETLNQLVRNDRYSVKAKLTDDGKTVLHCPHLKKQIKVNSIPLQEKLRFEIMLPDYVQTILPIQNAEPIALTFIDK